LELEITSWKAKMVDAMREIDNRGTAEKEKMLMNIQDLNMLMDDMAYRSRVNKVIPGDACR
jgi:hypothetical protein